MIQTYQIQKPQIVSQKADQRVHVKKLLQKYFSEEKNQISRRDLKELIVEYITTKTPEEIKSMHKKVELDTSERKAIYMEKLIFEFMDTHLERKFDKEYVEKIIQEKTIEKFLSEKVMEKTKKYKTEQHDHHRRKDIQEKVEEAVANLTGGEL